VKKKILFFIEDIGIGGQQHFNFTLARYLKRLGNEILVAYYLDGEFRNFFEKEAILINIDSPPKNWVKATKNPFHIFRQAIKLRKILVSNEIDILISNAPYTYFIGAMAKRIVKIKHVRLLGKEPSKEETLWKYFNFLKFEKTTDLFLSFSYANMELKSKGVKDSQLVDAINAVDTEFFKPTLSIEERNKIRTQLMIEADEFVIGWCGRIEKNMEIFNTVKMLKILLELNFKKFKFLIIGDGGYFEEFKEHISKNGLTSHSIFLGWQKPENVRTYLQCCDIMPLLDDDPIGGSIVREAMACKVPVLTVNGKRGFQKEWVKDNINGILIDSEDYPEKAAKVCIKMYNSREELENLAEKGVQYSIENLSFEAKSKTINTALDSILNS
jgi:glycosyltransferase involved in cell wall biosynthesis